MDKDETVWRIQDADFKSIMDAKYPHLTEEQKEKIIDLARNKFTIYGWEEYVEDFISMVAN